MMAKLGDALFHYRTMLSPLLLLLLLLPGPMLVTDPFVAAVAGLVVAGLGQIIRAATIGLDYIVRGGRNHRVYADDLVTGGLFRHVRNPMYVGKFLLVLGAGIASNRWLSLLAICGAYGFMYHAIVLAEEAYLEQKFGVAFNEYRRSVPRWLPRLRGIAETLSGAQFAWQRVFLKEYSAPLGWALPIVLIGLYNMRAAGISEEWPFGTAFLLSVLGLAVLLWIACGWIKKTRSPRFRLTDT